jgi:signal transduction histidine kinase
MSWMGFAELISDDECLAERSRTYITRINSCANKLLRLINDILDFSKLRAGRAEVHAAPLALQELLEQVVEETRALAQGTPIDVALQTEGDLGAIVSDDLKVRQILGNLMSNAVKFSDHGRVILSVGRETDNKIFLSVTDTGIGMSEEQLRIIFEPFRQVSGPDQRDRGGTGLGLAIVAKLTALLGGEISVKSKLGDGSTFTVVLPDRRV